MNPNMEIEKELPMYKCPRFMFVCLFVLCGVGAGGGGGGVPSSLPTPFPSCKLLS